MLAHRKRPSIDPNLVGRIDSEHLSEQFQRELSNSPGQDLLQDELKLDDISNASGSGVAALAHTTPPQVIRPDLLASMDVSDDNWLVASPLPSPTLTQGVKNRLYDPDRQQDSRRGAGPGGGATKLERSPSAAFSQAYAQPSKIPRLTQATSPAVPQQQPSRGLSSRPDLTPPSAKTRSRSGAGTDVGAVSPSPSRASVGVKPSHASPSRSVSDSGEDGLPVWRAVSKLPAPKYTQQTDIALGGPFQRSGSSQLPRANSTKQPRSGSRPTSRPVSAQTSQVQRAQLAQVEPQPAEQQQAMPQQAELQQAEPRSQPSVPQFQSRIPVAPAQLNDAVSPAESAKSNGGYANDGRFASGFAQVSHPAEQATVTDAPAGAEQPAAVAEGFGVREAHTNGTAQHAVDAELQQANVSKGQEGPAQSLGPVSPDQVHLGLPGHQEHSRIGSDEGAGQSAQMQKAKKCCCCVIM